MPDRSQSEQRLLEYLDPSAHIDKRAAFDAELLEDDGLFNQLVLAEDELIEAFVRGELSDPEAASLRGLFQSSARVQTKLETTLALGSWCPKNPASTLPQQASAPGVCGAETDAASKSTRTRTSAANRSLAGWWIAAALAVIVLVLVGVGQAELRALNAQAAAQEQLLGEQVQQIKEMEAHQRRLNLRLSRIEDGASLP